MASAETRDVLDSIDNEYSPIGCLGIGGFGSVFLTKKKSGRRVALKFMLMDTTDEDEFDTFTREIEAVVKLNNDSHKESHQTGNRDLSIVFFEDWKIGHHFVCIVMNYADGGTLAQEIQRKASRVPVEPYTERRVAWYALQICEALAYAHERGVAHHDVKSANILIDASAGGKLLLADFGASVKPGDDTVGFTRSYASPELLASHELEDYSSMQSEKIDSFGAGCILYELIMCNVLESSPNEQTLAQFIVEGHGLEAALALEHIKLPFLPPTENGNGISIGYTHSLKSLICNLLNPNVNDRWLPSQMTSPLRDNPKSPLLLPVLSACHARTPGAPVTMDNIQLGMFVQRGPDWDDGDADGGIGSIGVVVKLDADALYTEVSFPSKSSAHPVEQLCCRIGAGKKFELQIGPHQLPDYCSGTAAARTNGIVSVDSNDMAKIFVGQKINENCMIVGVDRARGIVFAAPLEKITIVSLPKPHTWATNSSSFVTQRQLAPPPRSWQHELGLYVNVTGGEERSKVLEKFYDGADGMKEDDFAVETIQRIQDTRLWESYARSKERVTMEYWGMSNETMAFAAWSTPFLQKFRPNGMHYSTKSSSVHDKLNGGTSGSKQYMLLCHVVLGRVWDSTNNLKRADETKKYHSILKEDGVFECRGPDLAYPQYIITYKHRRSSPSQRRIVQAVHPPDRMHLNSASIRATDAAGYHLAREAAQQQLFGGSPTKENAGRSPSKMCVVCMENPVRYLLMPCGHPCICDKCIAPRVLMKLKGKCPECRAPFKDTTIIYGRVVNDDA